jgi:DNA-binding response OmpR family regulator
MKKIMIVDDELDILDILYSFLSRGSKYDVEIYSNPEVALSKAINGRYDLLLSDIMMPQVSGMDILEKMKKNNSNVKVILMTAYSNDNKIEQSKELGADGYLEKPFKSLRSVEESISSVLGV